MHSFSTSYKLSCKAISVEFDIRYSPKGVLEIIEFLLAREKLICMNAATQQKPNELHCSSWMWLSKRKIPREVGINTTVWNPQFKQKPFFPAVELVSRGNMTKPKELLPE